MSYYLSREGQQVGPYSENQIREGISSGAIQPDALLWQEGWPDWRPVRDAFGLPATTPQLAPPMPQAAPTGAPKTSPAAIWSLVLGILSVALLLNWLAAIPGLILGIVGLRKINSSQGALTGRGLAITGIVFSCLGIVIVPLLLVSMAVPAYSQVRLQGRLVKDMSNVKQILVACRMFSSDNDGLYPGFDPDTGNRLATSTEVFNQLIKEGYVDTELIFWIPGNPDKPNPPNGDGILTKEENCYVYVAGQSDATYGNSPLVADEMEKPGYYGEKHPWLRLRKAVVGFCDGHVSQLPLTSSMPGATVQSQDPMIQNIFKKREISGDGMSSGGYLATDESDILLP